MAPRIRAIHSKYQKELDTVGRLLSDYGEIEIDLFNCVVVTAPNRFDEIFKAMFATRGEKRRIDEALRLGLPEYQKDGFKKEFEDAIAATHCCRSIRNQYAHAYWHNPGDGLCFVDLEGLASTPAQVNSLIPAVFNYVDQSLLDQQEDFYTYTQQLLAYANYERRRALGEINSKAFAKPAPRPFPHLHL